MLFLGHNIEDLIFLYFLNWSLTRSMFKISYIIDVEIDLFRELVFPFCLNDTFIDDNVNLFVHVRKSWFPCYHLHMYLIMFWVKNWDETDRWLIVEILKCIMMLYEGVTYLLMMIKMMFWRYVTKKDMLWCFKICKNYEYILWGVM